MEERAAAPETEMLLQWGNRKRLRCVRIRNNSSPPSHFSSSSAAAAYDPSSSTLRIRRRRIFSRFRFPSHQDKHLRSPRLIRSSETAEEEEERLYATRGAADHQGGDKETLKNKSRGGVGGGGVMWPKICIGLSNKEKEEDFMAMKGCKLPQRPKKRAKLIQRTLLLVSPGAWLTDMTRERYEVREKKTCKKRRKGLKALTLSNLDSDSE